MISLEILIQLNEKPRVIRDNFNRDSSFVQSAKGYVIHSGIHRSTAFVDQVKHAESFESLTYWKQHGQSAVNAWIETIIDGGSVQHAETEACKRLLPDWTITAGESCGTQGNRFITATRESGKFQERVSGITYRDLATRILHSSECQRAQWKARR